MKQWAIMILFLAGLVVAGCESAPVSKATTSNPNVQVGLLFNHDGCNIYRFEDAGELHYYTVCGNLPVTTTSNIVHSAGKTTYITPDEIATVQR